MLQTRLATPPMPRTPPAALMLPTQQRRLLAATRLHHLLLRRFGQGIDVAAMLSQPAYAHQVLAQCRAMNDHDEAFLACLRTLEDGRITPLPDAGWAHDTSGFGVTEPLLWTAPAPAQPRPAPRSEPAAAAHEAADELDLDLSQPNPHWPSAG